MFKLKDLIRIEDYNSFNEEGYSTHNLLGLVINNSGMIEDVRLGNIRYHKEEGIIEFLSPEGDYIENINYVTIINSNVQGFNKCDCNYKKFSIKEANKHPEKIVTNKHDSVKILLWNNYKNKDFPIICLDDSGNVFSVSEDGLGDNGVELLIVEDEEDELLEKLISGVSSDWNQKQKKSYVKKF